MENAGAKEESLEQIERELLLEGIFRHYGYDFREYALGSLTRRIHVAMTNEGVSSISGLLERVLHDAECMKRFVSTLAIHVTSMFRNPKFYLAFRKIVVPMLRTYPFVRIWIAGCSSGEEVYSMAIILWEEGIYDRCRIYATDFSGAVITHAQSGIFPLSSMKDYTHNYQLSGGQKDFSSYYTAKYDSVIFKQSLKKNITFSQHNLASDASFNEFNVITCRNVMIYFSNTLQDRVLQLMHNSLGALGFLGLGEKESLRLSLHESCYEELEEGRRLYRRVK